MRWQFDESMKALRISLNDGSAPSREEVDATLHHMRAAVGDHTLEAVFLDGHRVGGRLTYHHIVSPILYQAARRRTRGSGSID